jgi:hypothetical protein
MSPDSDTPIAIEAKSRRRVGVLHASEGGQAADSRWIRKKLKEATEQNPDRFSLIVFLDLNTPKKADHDSILAGLQSSRREVPRAYNAAVITNLAHHYGAPKVPTPDAWKVFYSPPKTTVKPPGERVFPAIQEALRTYGQDIPEEI